MYHPSPQAEAVFRGIKHEIVSEEDPKTLNAFRTSGIEDVEFLGGYNIRVKDGTLATISFNCFVMFIWSDF